MDAPKLLRSASIVVGFVALLASAGAAASTHTVRRGDTLGGIARAHRVPVQALAAANDVGDADQVRAGATLRVPDPAAAGVARAVPIAARSSQRQAYIVRAGDTLSNIARRFGTNVATLVADNDLGSSAGTLRQGRPLQVARVGSSPTERPLCPVRGAGKFDFSDSFGSPRDGRRRHAGNDIFARRGTPVVAGVAGTIRGVTGDNVGIGYYLDGDDGVTYYGAHLATLRVGDGPVARGAIIGTVGATGNAKGTPPHLHFEVKPGDGASIDPYALLRTWCR